MPLLPLTAVQLAVTGIAGLLISALFEAWTQPFTATTGMWLVESIFIATSLRFALQLQGQNTPPSPAPPSLWCWSRC